MVKAGVLGFGIETNDYHDFLEHIIHGGFSYSIFIYSFFSLSCSWAMICGFGVLPIIVLLALSFSFLQNLLGALKLLFDMKTGKDLES